jgi:hypothetical protein
MWQFLAKLCIQQLTLPLCSEDIDPVFSMFSKPKKTLKGKIFDVEATEHNAME